ncbi:MAG: LysR substrate-binding domain-containing protein [Bdellovibrionia bacterium]
MLNYPIPPEYCLIVNAFNQADTLRGAAQLLNMDPAGLVRKVQKISAEYGFLQKVGNRWAVTESGRRVAQWTDEIINSQKRLQDEKPRMRIAAFTWLAEEMLIPEFDRLSSAFEPKYSWSFKMIASDLEQELIQSRSDFVIHGTAPRDPAVAYKKVSTHPWVVVVPYSWKKHVLGLSEVQLIAFLQSRPFVWHSVTNPEQVLGFRPRQLCDLAVDGVIGLRSAVAHELGWSALPAMSARTYVVEKKIHTLNLRTHIRDDVSIWWLRARRDTASISKAIIKWVAEYCDSFSLV